MAIPEPGNIGSLIRTFRLRASLSQEELAERSGLSLRAISDLERGLRTTPRMETLRMLAGALDLSAEQRMTLLASAHPELRTTPEMATDTKSSPIKFPEQARKAHCSLPIPRRSRPAGLGRSDAR